MRDSFHVSESETVGGVWEESTLTFYLGCFTRTLRGCRQVTFMRTFALVSIKSPKWKGGDDKHQWTDSMSLSWVHDAQRPPEASHRGPWSLRDTRPPGESLRGLVQEHVTMATANNTWNPGSFILFTPRFERLPGCFFTRWGCLNVFTGFL